ncbi:MAG: cytochrome c biogenesis protein ResB [Firmicutes bacterium]|nr:cytochrome c biogenesis protein ResB [Bacillota bacterium]
MGQKIINLIVSRRTAVILLLIITFLFVLGSLLPKVDFLPPAQKEVLKANNPLLYTLALYLSPPRVAQNILFLMLTGILTLSLIFCTVKRWSRPGTTYYSGNPAWQGTWRDEAGEYLLARLKNWRMERQDTGNGFILYAWRGRIGFAGSLLFHWGLLLILLGGFVTYLTSLNGGLVATEGQSIPVTPENFVRVSRLPLLGTPDKAPVLKVDKVNLEMYNEKYIRQYLVDVSVLDEGGRELTRDRVLVNKPLKYRGYRMTLEDYGVAPWFVLKKLNSQEVIFDSFFNLRVLNKSADNDVDIHDSIYLPGGNEHLMFRFFSDFDRRGNKLGSRSPLVKNPVFLVDNGSQKQLLAPGEKKEIGPYTLEFRELRYWAYFKVVRDPGEAWSYIGFAIASLGLVMRLLDGDKRLCLEVSASGSEQKWTLGGEARLYPVLFGEWLQETARGMGGESVMQKIAEDDRNE